MRTLLKASAATGSVILRAVGKNKVRMITSEIVGSTTGELMLITAQTSNGEILWKSASNPIGNTTTQVCAGIGLAPNDVLLASNTSLINGNTIYAFQGTTVQLSLPEMDIEVDCEIVVVGDIGATCIGTVVWYESLERKQNR